MDRIEQKIKDSASPEFPEGLHGRIMRALIVRRYRLPLFLTAAVVFSNIFISGMRINTGMAQNGGLVAFGSFFKGFDMNYDYVSDFLGIVRDYVPLYSLSICLINIIFFAYLSKLYFDVAKYDGFERSKETI